jgi:hypothetical protein
LAGSVVHSPAATAPILSPPTWTLRGMTSRAHIQAQQPAGTDLLAVPAELRCIADRQAGVLTRSQLDAAGFAKTDVETAVRAQRWRALGRRVVVLQNAPLTAPQREWAAVLLPGKPAALAGLSAAASAGLCGFEPDRVHILVAHATEAGLPAWIKVHESRRFSPRDVNEVAAPPRTRVARSVLDGATWSRYPRRACAVLCAAVQQRLVTPEQLLGELADAGPVRHARLMRRVLGDIGGGAHTLAEIDLGRLAARAGLPPPHRQRMRREPSGRIRYLDAEFLLPDGTVLVVEVDGRGHMEVETWLDDSSRQNEVIIEGRPVLRFPSLTIRFDEERVIDQLRRMRLTHTP